MLKAAGDESKNSHKRVNNEIGNDTGLEQGPSDFE